MTYVSDAFIRVLTGSAHSPDEVGEHSQQPVKVLLKVAVVVGVGRHDECRLRRIEEEVSGVVGGRWLGVGCQSEKVGLCSSLGRRG